MHVRDADKYAFSSSCVTLVALNRTVTLVPAVGKALSFTFHLYLRHVVASERFEQASTALSTPQLLLFKHISVLDTAVGGVETRRSPIRNTCHSPLVAICWVLFSL